MSWLRLRRRRSRWLRSPWRDGPAAGAAGEVFVIATRFRAHRMIDLPGIVWRAYALRRRWHELSGAVGVWLWLDWRGKQTGSVSVWRSERDMRAFLRWEPHVRIIRRYRRAGTSTSTSWTAPEFDRRAIGRQGKQVISGWIAAAQVSFREAAS